MAEKTRAKLRKLGCWPAMPINGVDVWKDGKGNCFVYDKLGNIYNLGDTEMATMSEMVNEYNSIVPEEDRVERFSDKKTAEKRLAAAKGKPVVEKEEKAAGKRGRKSSLDELLFSKSPEGKIWQKDSSRSKVFLMFENQHVTINDAIAKASAELSIDPGQVRSCISILVREGLVTKLGAGQ